MKTMISPSETSMVPKAALAYVKCGLSVVPTGKDKIPRVKHWKERESKIPSEKSVKKDFSRPGICVAIVCGKVSGGLETIDFDFKAEQFKPWKDLVEMDAPGLVDRLVIQKTQSGGRHATYRCSNGRVPGSAKLMSKWIEVDGEGHHNYKGKTITAVRINDKYYISPAYIETRGEGGYFLAYPSEGYTLEQHRFSQVPNITPEERDILIEAAGALNERPPENPAPAREPRAKTGQGLSPGDDYAKRGDVEALLVKHGWMKTNRRSSCGEGVHWRRPGKKQGQSATLYGSEHLYNFSANGAPFQAYTGYSAFAVYAMLEHGGDFSAAAKELYRQGYGSKPEKEPIPVTIEEKADLSFPYQVMTGAAGYFANVYGSVIEAPEHFLFMAYLTCLGAVLSKRLTIKSELQTQPRLYVALVGKSATDRKSTTLKIADNHFRSVVDRFSSCWGVGSAETR